MTISTAPSIIITIIIIVIIIITIVVVIVAIATTARYNVNLDRMSSLFCENDEKQK